MKTPVRWLLPLIGLGIALVLGRAWFEGAAGETAPGARPAAGAAASAAPGLVPAASAPERAAPAAVDLAAPSLGPLDDADPATLVVLLRWRGEDEPAPGVDLVVTRADAMRFGSTTTEPLPLARGRSDAAGRARFEGLPAGELQVVTDCGRTADVRTTVGASHVVEFEVDRGSALTVEVVALDELPVEGAHVLLDPWIGNLPAFELGRTDARGRLHVARAVDGARISAWSDDHGPSSSRAAGEARESGGRLRLILGAAGARLTVVVRDPTGAQRTDARVDVEYPNSWSFPTPDGVVTGPPASRTLRADANGVFAASGLEPGRAALLVGCTGLAPYRCELDLPAGRTLEREVVLGAPARVVGTVRDFEGRPVANARVGAHGEPGSFVTATRADGSYELGALPAETFTLRAEFHFGSASLETTLVAGEAFAWNPTLGPARALEGVVVDARGAGLPDWTVALTILEDPALEGQGASSRTTRTTDAEGAFRFDHVQEDGLTLVVREPGAAFRPAAVALDRIVPGGEPLVVRVPDARRATAWLAGRVLGPTDGARFEASLGAVPLESLSRWDRGREREGVEFDVAFRVGPFVPGEYSLELHGTGRAARFLGRRVLAPHEELDLGDLRLVTEGRLRVRFAMEGGGLPDAVWVTARAESGAPARYLELEHETGLSEPLASGAYDLVAEGPTVLPARRRVVIAPDEVTDVSFELRPGTSRALAFALPADRGHGGRLALRVTSDAGDVVYDKAFALDPDDRDLRVFVGGLDLGGFSVAASTASELTAAGAFLVDALEPSQEPIEFELR